VRLRGGAAMLGFLLDAGEPAMSENEAWVQLARECPRKIMGPLHRLGQYVHGTCSRYPGKVLCLHHDSELPSGWQPTPAQDAASRFLRQGVVAEST
jgi:hypothetical protein